MNRIRLYHFCLLIPFFLSAFQQDNSNTSYKWLSSYDKNAALNLRIKVPSGYKRTNYLGESMGYWFEHLPLKSSGTLVKLYNGLNKGRQDVHEAVVNID